MTVCEIEVCVCVCVCALSDLKYFPVTMTIVLAEGSENNHLWVALLAAEVCAASENKCTTILYIFFLNERASHKKLISFSERPQQHKIRRTVVHCLFLQTGTNLIKHHELKFLNLHSTIYFVHSHLKKCLSEVPFTIRFCSDPLCVTYKCRALFANDQLLSWTVTLHFDKTGRRSTPVYGACWDPVPGP